MLTGRYALRCGVFSASEGGERINADEKINLNKAYWQYYQIQITDPLHWERPVLNTPIFRQGMQKRLVVFVVQINGQIVHFIQIGLMLGTQYAGMPK